MEALKGKDVHRARTLLKDAHDAYDAAGGPSDEQNELLALVATRVDAALVPGATKVAKRPPPPSAEELKLRAEAKAMADKLLMEAVQVFGDKSDGERFGTALELLERAREGFRRAGSDVEREREGVTGNLYSAIRAEQERAQRVDKLVRMKRMLELTKQKKKAEALGIDPDEIELQLPPVAPPIIAESDEAMEGDDEDDLAADILQAWSSEGVSSIDKEIDELEQQIQDLEDTL